MLGGLQEYRQKYDLDTLVKEEEEDSAILATARATVAKLLFLSYLRAWEEKYIPSLPHSSSSFPNNLKLYVHCRSSLI